MYYRAHVPRIAAAFDKEPTAVFPYIVRFVLATIQQQFHTVPAILDEWEDLGIDAPSCWGMKKDGLAFLESDAAMALAVTLQQCVKSEDRVSAIDALIEIPGINVVKAAFIAQLVGLNTACLDTQNLKLHQIDGITAFQIRKGNRAKTRLAKIKAYLTLCDELGTSETFWNSWCTLIGDVYPQAYPVGEYDVSVQHVTETLGRANLPSAEEVPF